MAGLSFFVDEHDVRMLIDRLNADTEIAFIVPDGSLGSEKSGRPPVWRLAFGAGHRRRWRAVHTVDGLRDGRHYVWHVPAGPLPLLKAEQQGRLVRLPDPPVQDPWAGWIEERSDPELEAPYFGPGRHAAMQLDLWTRHQAYTQAELDTLPVTVSWWTHGHDLLPASALGWTGSHSRPAPAQTQRWWNRMKVWMGRVAVRLEAFPGGRHGVFWAFPSALAKLKKGMCYDANGWRLDDAIRRANC